MKNKKYHVAIALNKQMAYSILDKNNYDFLRSFAEVRTCVQ